MAQLRTPPRLAGFDYMSKAVYFVTFTVWDRAHVFSHSEAAGIARDAILGFRSREWIWLLAYCVMPDHIHVLMKPRRRIQLSRLVTAIKNAIGRALQASALHVRWQHGYYDKVLRPGDSENEIAHYIVQNPVRAGLVEDSASYPFGGIVDRW